MSVKVPIALVDEATHPAVVTTFAHLSAGGGRPVNIHRSVAQSPEVFAKFVSFARSLRYETELDPPERELALLRILELAGGEYELKHHRRMARSVGLAAEKIKSVADAAPDLASFNRRESTILKFVDAFFSGAGVDTDIQRDMKAMFSDRQIVEITLTVALYLGLAHFTNTLDVPID